MGNFLSSLVRTIFNDRLVIGAICVYAIVVFFMAFPALERNSSLHFIEQLFVVFFFFEVLAKSIHFGLGNYLRESSLNKLDFVVVIASIPTMLSWFMGIPSFPLFGLLRLLRLVRLSRLFAFVPHMAQLMNGIVRALKASVLVMGTLLLYNFILSLMACQLFKGISPQYFGDPLLSMHTTFQLFTVEGWNEISDSLTAGAEGYSKGAIRLWFIFVVLTGGIFGLSLANAVFVDEMTLDNNQELENKIDRLNKKIDALGDLLENRKDRE